MVLGHEVIGATVTEAPSSSTKVAINPSCPCNICEYCLEGRSNQYVDMHFFGSAMFTDGGFAQYVAVVIHEKKAGSILGKKY